MAQGQQTEKHCSFCGKGQSGVKRLISGPGAVYICDECADLCQEILNEEISDNQTAAQDREILHLVVEQVTSGAGVKPSIQAVCSRLKELENHEGNHFKLDLAYKALSELAEEALLIKRLLQAKERNIQPFRSS